MFGVLAFGWFHDRTDWAEAPVGVIMLATAAMGITQNYRPSGMTT
jgi:hypothetical protein